MSHKISHDVISISAPCICLTAFHPLTCWQPFRSTDSLLVPTFLSTQSMFILALWAGSFHLHYPTLPLKHHDYEEDVPTSSQHMADHTAMIYDSMYTHGIMACIYPIQFPAVQPATTLKVHTVLLLLQHILFYPPSDLSLLISTTSLHFTHSAHPPAKFLSNVSPHTA
jgi:hypothetical protein